MNRLVLLKGIGLLMAMANLASGQTEPRAGNWKTWVISSGQAIKSPPPPDKKASDIEAKELLALQKQRDAEALKQVSYWNAGAPGYRWNGIANQIARGNMPPFRVLALINVAIYDATIAAWNAKYIHHRVRPSKAVAGLKAVIPVPESPSYPCEHSATAGAAAAVLSYLLPAKADSLQALARQTAQSRVLAGVAYPSDVAAGLELGQKVAEKVIAWAMKDGSEVAWNGKVPTAPGLWNGSNPVGANIGSWKTWVLDSASQFRPGPPPDFAKDMQELRSFKSTQQSRARAFYFATQNVWGDEISKLLFENNLTANAPRAARVYALSSVAQYDAFVACWEAKYTYWGIRPYQYDTTYHQLLGAPPFPGYPSGHATTSSATATVLAYLFPAEATHLQQYAAACAESRFEGGIHFRTDNEVGLAMGRKIAEAVIQRARADGADSQPHLVKK